MTKTNDKYIYDFNVREYLSKEEIAQRLGNNYNESIWNSVKKQRMLYALAVETLKKNNDESMFVVMSPTLILKEISVHNKLLSLWKNVYEIEIKSLHSKEIRAINNYEISQVAQEVICICKNYGYKINRKILLDIYCHNIPDKDLSEEYIFAKTLFSIFENMNTLNNVNFDKNLVFNWLSSLDNKIKKEKMFRTSNAEGVPGSYTEKTMGYKSNQLEIKFNVLAQFINRSNDYPVVMKAAFTFYYIKYGLFFEEYNDIIAIFAMYYVIGTQFNDIVKLLSFINTALAKEKEFDAAYRNSLISNSDMTYITWEILNVISESIDNINKVVFQDLNKYKMPWKQEGEHSRKRKANMIRVFYPQLSLKSALFLIKHRKTDGHYTLENYQEFCKCSYETARYSFNQLIELGFYVKEKIGKKFTYCITDKELPVK